MRRRITLGLLLPLLLVAGCATAPPPQPNPVPPSPPESFGRCRLPAPQPQPGMKQVLVYFTCDEEQHPIARLIPAQVPTVPGALMELLMGPTPLEAAAGFTSWFSHLTGGMLRDVKMKADGTAVVDLTNFAHLIPNASTSAGSAQLIGELSRTVFQDSTIKAVQFQFEGNCNRFWNWLQSDCQTLRRDQFK